MGAGAGTKDVPFVGESGGRESQKVYTIAAGLRYEPQELEAARAKARPLDSVRQDAARRFIHEAEDRLVFLGDKKHAIPGLLNHPKAGRASALESGEGGTAAEKRLWKNKTSMQMLEDLWNAVQQVNGRDGVFKADTLILPPEHEMRLKKPLGEAANLLTVQKWLETEGMYFQRVLSTSAVARNISGLKVDSVNVDSLIVMDSRREIAEIALPRDIQVGQPVYDALGNVEMVISERCAGAVIRYPAGILVYTGI